MHVCVCMCVCVCMRSSFYSSTLYTKFNFSLYMGCVHVCVCVREREIEREGGMAVDPGTLAASLKVMCVYHVCLT
jgi:hypothetical protein